ncbi:MAG: gliding motility lipoprotein GldD [Bacteroidetes bacterium]|nr:gliding motility lipoprotein GldD [Bacteroidota bacterium]
MNVSAPSSTHGSRRLLARPWTWGLGALLLVAGAAWWVQPESMPVPRPKGQVRITLPDTATSSTVSPCGASFRMPSWGGLVERTPPTGEAGCWYDLFFPSIRATLHCTEVPVQGQLQELVDDAHELVYGHEVAAAGLHRSSLSEDGKLGILYVLEGPVAAPIQFFVTDSTEHFLRGSLYFNHRPNPDSTAPVLARMEWEVQRLMETVDWR